MGDLRFDHVFAKVKNAKDRVREIQSLSDDEVIAALGGATRAQDRLLANVLATEAQNRAQRATAVTTSLGEGVLVVDRSWRIALQNPAAERILGWTSAEIVGSDPHAILHPFCNRPDACHLGKLPPPGFFHQDDDAHVMRKDGRAISVAYTITPLMRRGEVDGGVLVIRDSSERKRQEEKAGERQDRLQTLLETLAEGILTMDRSGRITYANPAAERIIGRAARDIMARAYFDPEWSFVTRAGEILPVSELPFKRALDTHRPVLDAELGIRRGDGTVAILRVDAIPLPDANRDPSGLLVSFREIAKREGTPPSAPVDDAARPAAGAGQT